MLLWTSGADATELNSRHLNLIRPSSFKIATVSPLHEAPIILVEDNPDDALLVRRALDKAGIANPISTFQSVDEVMEHFASREVPLPALFILDVSLAGAPTGIDCLRWIRQQPGPLGTTPAMMVTGSTSYQDRDEAALLSAVYFLTKPVTVDAIVSAVQSLRVVL